MTLFDLYQIPFKIARKFEKTNGFIQNFLQKQNFLQNNEGGARSGVWGSEGLGVCLGVGAGDRGDRGGVGPTHHKKSSKMQKTLKNLGIF